MKFEWDENKNARNIEVHQISFSLATRVFFNERVIQRSDRKGEVRYIAIGKIYDDFISVAYTLKRRKYKDHVSKKGK